MRSSCLKKTKRAWLGRLDGSTDEEYQTGSRFLANCHAAKKKKASKGLTLSKCEGGLFLVLNNCVLLLLCAGCHDGVLGGASMHTSY